MVAPQAQCAIETQKYFRHCGEFTGGDRCGVFMAIQSTGLLRDQIFVLLAYVGRGWVAGACALSTNLAVAAWDRNLQMPVTESARRAYDLHTGMLWLILIIFFGVFAVVGYSLYAHRRSKGHQPAQFHDNTAVEILWTVVPFIILVFVAIPATRSIVAMRDASLSDMTIKATGYQWKWGYEYLTGDAAGIKFMSVLATTQDQIKGLAPKGEHYLLEVDRPLVVPVNRKIRILTTSADVIHDWSVPAFAVKTDAVPGFVRETWFRADQEGTFRGQCSELCGKDHGFMPVVVEVMSEQRYAAWTTEQRALVAAAAEDPNKVWTLAAQIAYGEKVYVANCVACHQVAGTGLPPAIPALDGSKVVKGPKLNHISLVLKGKAGTAMASFADRLTDTDLAAVVAYERNAWSNHSGDTIQPAEVVALRGK
jgi:cytochrome c oxidase subunit 2